VTTLRRLAAQNLAEEHPSRLAELFFHTHPSFAQRISTARQRVEQ
jgi:Zn-dependent protease with chaperone function